MAKKKQPTVLFDIDGTLLDTHGFGREAFIRGLAHVTGERDELAYVSFAGNTDRNVLDQVMAHRNLRLAEAEIRRIFARIAEELRELLRANPGKEIAGARRLLKHLAAEGTALGLPGQGLSVVGLERGGGLEFRPVAARRVDSDSRLSGSR